jgi:CheY-like chemotaxis protein
VIAACLTSYDVTVTHNGPEALARASQLPACDLLITDYLMPVILGDEVARRLRAMHPAAKTLLLTGYAESVTVDRTAVDAQMAKPFRAGRAPGDGEAPDRQRRQPRLRPAADA